MNDEQSLTFAGGEVPVTLAGAADAPRDLTYFGFVPAHDQVQPSQAQTVKEIPRVLAGRYRIERLLGVGGMNLVYKARDLLHEQYGDPDPSVAIKILGEEIAECADASALLFSEFALTRHLQHPNIARVFSFNMEPECQRGFITQELMSGLTLDKLLCERPDGLPWSELRDIALELLDALANAHAHGVLHGDIKPSNVMLDNYRVKLFDFGLGQSFGGVLPGLARLSRERFNAWTPSYAAPELFDGFGLSTGSDMFAVACVLFELACGKHPYLRVSSDLARDLNLGRTLRRPRKLPRRCWPALKRALRLNPNCRTSNALHLYDAFNAVPVRGVSASFG
ncbi:MULTISPECIES: serine/threonine-protein kinase [Pseudomonas]|uniref:serine/threonine-protein kinase n=1 Tax=Pseudomonas TaxID=286 RepID=UPI0030027E5E